jgi:hypothetical protein
VKAAENPVFWMWLTSQDMNETANGETPKTANGLKWYGFYAPPAMLYWTA